MSVSRRTIFGRNPAHEDDAVLAPVRDETLSLSKTHFEAAAESSGGWVLNLANKAPGFRSCFSLSTIPLYFCRLIIFGGASETYNAVRLQFAELSNAIWAGPKHS